MEIFIGNLSPKTTFEHVRRFFRAYGRVFQFFPHTGYGFVVSGEESSLYHSLPYAAQCTHSAH